MLLADTAAKPSRSLQTNVRNSSASSTKACSRSQLRNPEKPPLTTRPSGFSSSTRLSHCALTQQATQRRHASLLVTALAAASTVQDAVSTKIVLRQCELAFGESVRVVGDTDKLGNWSHDNGPELQWREGHNWEADLELFPGTSSFKLVIVHGDGSPQWEGGDNRSVMVPADVSGGQVTFGCYFDQTASTEVQVTPAASAAQQDAIPNTEEDVVDQFAAGDAAPQVEAKHQTNGSAPNSSVIEDNLIDEFAAGDAAAQVEGAQGQADKVEERAEVRQQTGSPQQQSQASAVQQEMKQAAPKEDLEDTLSVLQGAESDLQEQQASQAPKASKRPPPTKSDDGARSQAQTEPSVDSTDDSSKSQGATPDPDAVEDAAQSFPVFGKSKVSGIARDGSITFTFEEDDDIDLQELTSQLLG